MAGAQIALLENTVRREKLVALYARSVGTPTNQARAAAHHASLGGIQLVQAQQVETADALVSVSPARSLA